MDRAVQKRKGEMDRISQLPEPIIHHILSFLDAKYRDTKYYFWCRGPPRELVRMSVLSKTWFHLTASCPFLNFETCGFASKEAFYKYVDYTTTRFCQQNVPAQRFTLITDIRNAAQLDTVNRCLELVSKNGVMDLKIKIYDTPKPMSKYPLTNTLLCFSMLKSLTIHGCELPSSLMAGVFKFKSLIKLTLDHVQIDDEAIKYLTTSCPLLQVISFRFCYGFKSFCLYGHQNLQKVFFDNNREVESINIDAPNFFELSISSDMDERGAPRMNLASCKKLTTVCYSGNPLPNSNDSTNFLSYFPFVENLTLNAMECKNLKLSSHSLRILVLHSHCDLLKDIEFCTPNLALFIYPYQYCSPIVMDKRWPQLRDSTHLRASMHCHPPDECLDTFWFKRLRLFLDKKNGFKPMNLYISAKNDQKLEDLAKLKGIEFPPYELEHVELQLDTYGCGKRKSFGGIPFVDAVLWCFRPQSLTLRSFPSRDFEKVVEFTYEKLLQQEVQVHTKIQIVWPNSESQKHFDDSKSLSMALPRERKTISFIKKNATQEEAKSQRYADMKIFQSNDFRSLIF